MNEETGAHYLQSWPINETVIGLGGIGKVIKSCHSDFNTGDYVQGALFWPWKRYFIVNIEEKKDAFAKVCTWTVSVYAYSNIQLKFIVTCSSL